MLCPHCGFSFISTRKKFGPRETAFMKLTGTSFSTQDLLFIFPELNKEQIWDTAARLVRKKIWVKTARGHYALAKKYKKVLDKQSEVCYTR